jgi:hypothetical protein
MIVPDGIELEPPPEELMVISPVFADTVMFDPAFIRVTPVLFNVTLPEVPPPDKPVPAVTPVIVPPPPPVALIVTSPVADDTEMFDPAFIRVTPVF